MFATLAKSGFARLWPVQPRRPRPQQAGLATHCNDNLPGFRRPAATGKRRSPMPALACHWFERDGRLECRWQAEPDGDAPGGGLVQSDALDRVTGPTRDRAVIHKSFVEPSYQERCCRARTNVRLTPTAALWPIRSAWCVARTSLDDATSSSAPSACSPSLASELQ